ncbi:PEP-CTERM sorting domain-containing protein [Botrimarina sp.]|uniref:PEP-CTERM sorting domain-containing protein n=1 Tax=Botrimarina sp. TaxID=2795802 RepID=UPI0032F05959
MMLDKVRSVVPFALGAAVGLASQLAWPGVASAAVRSAAIHNASFEAFDTLLSDSDIIAGIDEEPETFLDPGVFEGVGDLGWHPANPASSDPSRPEGLTTFTDGVGAFQSGLNGLLNENFIGGGDPPQPEPGAPVKVVEYILDSPRDIGRINILSGNRLDADGRIFSTVLIRASTDDGLNFTDLGYFQSDPSGTVNEQSPLSPPQRASLMTIVDDSQATLLSGVTNIEFTFFAVSDTTGRLHDPFDGVNPYTGVDDGLSPAFQSPLIWEIDVLSPAAGIQGDYNADGLVNAADYTVWRDTNGDSVIPGEGADGNGDGTINGPDYEAWRLNYGLGAAPAAATPEPTTLASLLAAAAVGAAARRRQ